jgi:hypothetical protein
MLFRFYTHLVDVADEAPRGQFVPPIFDWGDFLIGFVLINLSKVKVVLVSLGSPVVSVGKRFV